MITVQLDYPFSEDLINFGIPSPLITTANKIHSISFDGRIAYFKYLDDICNIIDTLEVVRLERFQSRQSHKLAFCKKYIALLATAILPIN